MLAIKWTHILIHHSATKDGRTLSFDDIRRIHVKERGWADIGYHFVCERVEDDWIVIAGRPLDRIGAHCANAHMNHKAIGFCFVGNYSEIEPPIEMLVKAVPHIKALMEIFGIPVENVKGHRDFKDTECPGKKFDLNLLRSFLL